MVGTGLWGSLSPRALLIVPKSMGTISLAGMVASSRVPTHGGDTHGGWHWWGTGIRAQKGPSVTQRGIRSLPLFSPGFPGTGVPPYSQLTQPPQHPAPPRPPQGAASAAGIPVGQGGTRTSGLPGP